MATREERDLALRHAGIPRTVRAAILDDGGGSAFAHLSEDAGTSKISATWDTTVFANFHVATADVAGVDVYADGHTEVWASDVLSDSAVLHGFAKWSDDVFRLEIHADGSLHWGDGTAAPVVGLAFNPDWGLQFLDPTDGGYGMVFGDPDAQHVFLSTNISVSDGASVLNIDAGSLHGTEIADPAAPSANSGRLYFKDVGGKTAIVARFPTGAVQQIAIEP